MGGLWHEMEELRSAQHDWENPPEDDPEEDEVCYNVYGRFQSPLKSRLLLGRCAR